MKLTTFILIIALAQVSARGFGQKITLNTNHTPIEKVLQSITNQSGYEILYDLKDLKDEKVSLKLDNVSVEEAIRTVLKDLPFTYQIIRNNIVLKKEEPSLLDKLADVIQSITKDLVKGRVVDQDGKPLPNASIRIKGKNTVINTNQNGEFEIKDVAEDAVLVISYVGYKTLVVNLKDATLPLQIKLNVQTGELEEVNVSYSTGYQNIPKERATGSFVQIDNETLNLAVGTNVLDRLLNVTNSLKFDPMGKSGSGGSDITIRGFSTINANKKPLIVLDGFVYDEDRGGTAAENFLRNINPNDIESVTILRDAAAGSIWGARSGNGVIVINTKKGKYNQNTQVSFNTNVNLIEKPRLNKMNLINPMDVIEFEKKQFATGMYDIHDDVYPSLDYFLEGLSPAIELLLAARKRNSGIPGYKAQEDPAVLAQLTEMGSHDVRDDVSKYLMQTAVNQQYALNISGGTEKIKYYGSVGYDRNLPTTVGNKDSRLTLRFDNTYRPLKNLELNTYLVYTNNQDVNNGIDPRTFLGTFSRTSPYSIFADAAGNPLPVFTGSYRSAYIDTASYPGLLDWHYRPLDELKNNDNTTNRYSTRFGGILTYTLIPGLKLEFSSQYEKELSSTRSYESQDHYNTRSNINRFMYQDASGKLNYPFPLGGALYFTDGDRTSWDVRGKLVLNKSWGRHQVDAIAAVEGKEAIYKANRAHKYGYDPIIGTSALDLNYGIQYPTRASFGSMFTLPNSDGTNGTLNRFVSYLANGGYTFDGKYTFTASARVDGSNFLGAKANQRFTPLWSTGLAWNISREQFFKISWLNSLNLRATYGYNGNLNNKGTALPTGRYAPSSGYHNGVYLSLLTPPNPGLTWEKNRCINFAMDYSVLNNRLTGTLEYYTKKGIDLIGNIVTDATVGVPQYIGNYASMTDNGVDLNLNSLNIDGQFKWSSVLNLSYNTDKITDYQQDVISTATAYAENVGWIIQGKPLLKQYSYPDAGLDPTNGNPRGFVNGEIKPFQEVRQNAKPEDLIYHGSATPTIFGNLANTISYQNFSLYFNISYRFNYFVKKTSIDYNGMFTGRTNVNGDYSLRWQKPGDENFTSVPSLPTTNDASRDTFYQNSESLIVKGDHIRLNDVKLSYILNKAKVKQLPFSNAIIYLYTSNLGILWRVNKQGVDPDFPDNSQIPVSRTLALGLNLNF